ncbi:MAG: TIM barrel protein [Candidatus Hadarchaeales archaeon]
MIYLGPAGVPLTASDKSTIGGVRRVAELGLNAMEVEFVRGVSMGREMARKVGIEARKLGVRLSVHCPYFVNLCSVEKVKLEASKRRILDSADRAHAMGADLVVFHPGFYGKLTPQQALEAVVEACTDLRKRMEKARMEEVCLGLETMGKQKTFGTLEEILTVSREVEGCVPVVDWAHLYARSAGEVKWGEVFERVRHLKHLHTHFTGVEFRVVGPGKGNEDHHLEMPAGKPPFEPLGEEILKRKVDITIISESPALERDSLLMREFFEKRGVRF